MDLSCTRPIYAGDGCVAKFYPVGLAGIKQFAYRCTDQNRRLDCSNEHSLLRQIAIPLLALHGAVDITKAYEAVLVSSFSDNERELLPGNEGNVVSWLKMARSYAHESVSCCKERSLVRQRSNVMLQVRYVPISRSKHQTDLKLRRPIRVFRKHPNSRK